MPLPEPRHPTARLGVSMAIVAVVTFAAALVGLNARATYGAQVTADEPQYLLSALSLGEDLDLDISDELADRRFLDFHELALNPQTIELNDSGQRLSPHDPGLPLLLAVPMRVGGWRLAKAALAVLAATAAATTSWVAIRRFGVSVPAATITTICLFAAPPLTSYATQVYPEMPAAMAVVIAVAAVTGDRASARWSVVAVIAIGFLPWLAIKYAPVALVLAIGLYASLVRTSERRSAVAISVATATLTVLGVTYLVFHQRVYGGWTVYSAGDHFTDGEFLVVGDEPDYIGRSRRLIGLLVDRGFGLVAWAPAYLLMIPALVAMARDRARGWLLIGAAFGAGWAVATWVALTMHGWWWPGRQTVVVLPLAVIAIAKLVDGRDALTRGLIGASTLAIANWLWLVVEASTGRRTLIVDFTETSSPAYRLWSQILPDHRRFEAVDIWMTVAWIAIIATACWLAWRSAPGPIPSTPVPGRHREPSPTG